MPKINLPVPGIDSVIDPLPHGAPAGDWHDDDGPALDSYFESMDLGPLVAVLTKAMTDALTVPKSSRIIRQRFIFPGVLGTRAVQIFPADPNRTLLVVQTSKVAGGGVYVAGEAFQVMDGPDDVGSNTMGFDVPNATQLVIPNYTGAVYAASNSITAQACRADFLAITS